MFDVDRNQSDVRLSMSFMPPDSTEFKKKERSIMSTGDILSPRKQAVMDRLRRRFDRYRAHQFSCLPRYNLNLNGLIDQQHQETRNLRQRFLETKTKKANKKSEPKSKSGLSAGAGASGGGGGGNESSGTGGAGNNSGSVNNSLGVNSGNSGSGSNSASNPSAGSGAGTQNSNASLNGPQAKYKRTAEDSSSPLGCSRSASGQKNNDANMSSGVSSGSNNKTNLGKSNLTQISAEFEFSSPGQQIQMNVKVTTVASNNIKTSGSPAPSTGPSVVSSNSGSCKSTTTTSVIDSNSELNGGNANVRAVSKTVVNNNNTSNSEGIEKSVDDEHQDNKVGYQISCKQEPELDLGSCGVSMDCPGNGASHSFTDSFTNFDLNEDTFKALMEDWTSEDMNPIDLMNLEKFEDSVDPFRSDHSHLHGLTDPQHHQVDKSGIDADNRNLGQLPPYPVGNQSGNQVLPMFPVSSSSDSMTLNLLTNMNNSTMRPPSYTTQTTLGGLDFLAKETSPAAQTLKQMAEQHQQQRQQQHLSNIGLSTSSPFSSDFNQFGGAGNTNNNSVSMDFLSSTGGSGGCFLPKSGSGPLFSFDSNPLASAAGVNKNSETLYRPTQRFHLPSHLQEASKNQMNQQRTADAKNICSGNNSNGGVGAGSVNSGPTQNLLTGHCSPDLSCNSATTGSPLSFVGTKPLSHFGDSGQTNNNSPNNGTRQYVRTSGGPTQPQQQQPQQQLRSSGGASSPSSNVNLRQQRHHFMGMSSSQNGHHLQVSQGPHANVTSDQQPATMFNYGQPAPQGAPSGTGDHFQLSLSQSQAMTFAGANGASIANSGADRMVSVNQTTVVQLSSGVPPLNMMGHHSQLLRPATMQNQHDQPQQQQQQQMMQMQMEKRKLSQQQVRNSHSGMTQFGARPPPPDYGTQMNLMSGPQQQQQQSSPVMMPGVIGNQSGQLLMNSSSINNRGGNGPQPRLATALNVGSGGRLPIMNNRNGQQINLGQIGMSGSGGVPVNVNRTNMGMGGRFLGDDTRPPNVEIGPDGLSIGMRSNGESAGDWRQKMNHNQHPSAKFQGANLCQMGGVNPRFSGQILTEQRGMQSNNVDNVQMISLQQQQQLNMINRLGAGVVNNCPSQSTLGTAAHHQHHHPHHQLNHHQQMSTMMQQQQPQSNSNSQQQQSVNAHLMSQMSSSVVASAGSNFLSGDPSSGDFSDFFENGGFGANDLLNSLELDIQNGNSGVHLL